MKYFDVQWYIACQGKGNKGTCKLAKVFLLHTHKHTQTHTHTHTHQTIWNNGNAAEHRFSNSNQHIYLLYPFSCACLLQWCLLWWINCQLHSAMVQNKSIKVIPKHVCHANLSVIIYSHCCYQPSDWPIRPCLCISIHAIIRSSRVRLRLRLRQCSFNQNRYRYHIMLTKTNQYTITIYSWYIMKLMHGGRPPLRSYLTAGMGATRRGRACTRSERIHNATFWKRVPRRPPPGPPLQHPYYRRDSEPIWGPDIRRWNLRVLDPQMNRSDPTQRR